MQGRTSPKLNRTTRSLAFWCAAIECRRADGSPLFHAAAISEVSVDATRARALIELVAGSNSWIGNKSEPTTLGILTVVLAGIIATSAAATYRIQTAAARLAVAAGLAVPALVSLTTAGRFSVPGALAGIAAARFVAADATNRGSVTTSISQARPNAGHRCSANMEHRSRAALHRVLAPRPL